MPSYAIVKVAKNCTEPHSSGWRYFTSIELVFLIEALLIIFISIAVSTTEVGMLNMQMNEYCLQKLAAPTAVLPLLMRAEICG